MPFFTRLLYVETCLRNNVFLKIYVLNFFAVLIVIGLLPNFSELVIAYSRAAAKKVNLFEALKYGLFVHRNLKFKIPSILLSVGITDVYSASIAGRSGYP